MTNFEFMQAAEKKVAQCWAILMQRYNKVLPSPTLEFALGGRCAGMHMGRSGVINLNMGFVLRNGDDMLQQTVPHEVVHAWLTVSGHPSHVGGGLSASSFSGGPFTPRRKRRSPHGPEFMAILGSLGCDQRRTHNYDTSELKTKRQGRHDWKCPKCGHVFSVSTCIHNKMMRGQIRFHPKCGRTEGQLVWA